MNHEKMKIKQSAHRLCLLIVSAAITDGHLYMNNF